MSPEPESAAKTKKRQMVAARRKKVAALFLRGVTSHTEIAELLNLRRLTVAKDLEFMAGRWRDESQRDFEKAYDIAYQKLEDREREVRAWFRRTQQPAEIVRTKTIIDPDSGQPITETVKEIRGQAGDGKGFASAMRDIDEQRQRLQKLMLVKQQGLQIHSQTNIQVNAFSDKLLAELKKEIDAQLGIEDSAGTKASDAKLIDLAPGQVAPGQAQRLVGSSPGTTEPPLPSALSGEEPTNLCPGSQDGPGEEATQAGDTQQAGEAKPAS